MQENQLAWLAGEGKTAGILVPQMLMEMLGPLRDQSRRENRGLPVGGAGLSHTFTRSRPIPLPRCDGTTRSLFMNGISSQSKLHLNQAHGTASPCANRIRPRRRRACNSAEETCRSWVARIRDRPGQLSESQWSQGERCMG